MKKLIVVIFFICIPLVTIKAQSSQYDTLIQSIQVQLKQIIQQIEDNKKKLEDLTTQENKLEGALETLMYLREEEKKKK